MHNNKIKSYTLLSARKMKFSIKYFFSFWRILSQLLKKSLIENLIFLRSDCFHGGKYHRGFRNLKNLLIFQKNNFCYPEPFTTYYLQRFLLMSEVRSI